ncbi:ABC transporter substrate-binding protein [Bradyrhizobium sp. NP1]|uniref:ABC transporter substrate-binding protein n=1 Tax=Bradyrhizobium sp. NP1 TaxID=3049772 RepID=UPI0025A5B7AA|nr:ABC transporter substrate-binding protein [Bradyrhizobium sp. NP1]WJR80317.1 ABC transporter substrate-binding protein [Bradyrhizobium sp. NP1]
MSRDGCGMFWRGAGVAFCGAILLSAIDSAAAQDRTGITDTSIKIGIFQPLTGPATIFGYPVSNGVTAVFDEANAKGGINGRKIEIVLEDDGCDNAKTVAAVKKLIYRDRVFALHGGTCSAGVLASKPEMISSKVPYLAMGATVDAVATPLSPNIFSTIMPASQEGVMIAQMLRDAPGQRVAIVKHADEWADTRTTPMLEALKGSGKDIVATVQLDRRAVDATAQVLQLKEAKPDVTAVILFPAELAVFLRDAQKYGLKGPFAIPTSGQDIMDLARRAGSEEALADIYTISQMRGVPGSEQMKPLEELIHKYYKDEKIQQFSFLGISGAVLMVDALKRAGRDIDRQKFLAALEQTKGLDAEGADCKIEFSPTDHQACKTGTWLTYRNGKIVVLGPHWHKFD